MKRFYFAILFLLLFSTFARAQVENYLQFTPSVANGVLTMCGVKSNQSDNDRLFVTVASWGFTYAFTGGMKYVIHEERPDGSDNNSFPSGHAARAFRGATALAREYGDISPWVGIAGFACATTTAVLRVKHKKHYVHDVIAGAAIGILSDELANQLLPVWKRITHSHMKQDANITLSSSNHRDFAFAVVPSFAPNQAAISGAIVF